MLGALGGDVMTRAQINKWAGILPLSFSALALALVLFVIATGWERNLPDEGAAAHSFQLLIAGQLSLIALFLGTANRSRPAPILRRLALQAAGIALAMGAVLLFRL